MTTSYVAAMEAIAREAGALLKDFFSRRIGYEYKGDVDLVTEADRNSEKLIIERIRAQFPDHDIMGEEGGRRETGSAFRWYVDPLDGTTNFAHSFPHFAVSIALAYEAQVIVGVVYDPLRDELFSVERDGTPTRDGAPIHCSTRDDLATALVGTGFGYDADVRRAQAAVAAALLPDVRDLRRLGSAAIDLCWTACGRLDAYYEHGLNAWDLAAGRLLCERAGLEVHDLAPVGPSGPGVLVSPPALSAPLLARLA